MKKKQTKQCGQHKYNFVNIGRETISVNAGLGAVARDCVVLYCEKCGETKKSHF